MSTYYGGKRILITAYSTKLWKKILKYNILQNWEKASNFIILEHFG